MKPVYIIIGIPGSGKNTQGRKLAEQLHLPYISAGDSIREYILNQSSLKQQNKLFEAYKGGPTNPTEVMLKGIQWKLNSIDTSNGFVLTKHAVSPVEEEILLEELVKIGFEVKKVFFLVISKENAIDRSLKRLDGGSTEKETDYQSMVQRIDNFITSAPKAKQFYIDQKLLVELNGERTLEEIFQEIYTSISIA